MFRLRAGSFYNAASDGGRHLNPPAGHAARTGRETGRREVLITRAHMGNNGDKPQTVRRADRLTPFAGMPSVSFLYKAPESRWLVNGNILRAVYRLSHIIGVSLGNFSNTKPCQGQKSFKNQLKTEGNDSTKR